MRRVRVRSSLSRERLRDSAAGLREPPPALGMAFTGMIAKTKGIGVQLENFNAVLPNSDFSYPGTRGPVRGVMRVRTEHPGALFANKLGGDRFSLNVTLFAFCAVSPR